MALKSLSVEQGKSSVQSSPVTSGYSREEEIAHTITHGIGLFLSIAGLVLMVVYSSLYGDSWHITSTSIYGVTLILLYAASTLYHGVSASRAKQILQKLDHTSIYLLIAGTYTPFVLVSLRGTWGWTLFALVWGIALLGVVIELVSIKRLERLSIGLYLGLGWLVVVAIKPMLDNVETPGLLLLLTGGLFYSLGVIFYVWEKLTYHHAIWHLFVLAGSAMHFFAVFFFVVPAGT
ncbi:MAG: hemolysin III family protein [Gammaproteobacteria bacterium]|nr:hemolysin III family protein [Gammaproteobacteria bacterium]